MTAPIGTNLNVFSGLRELGQVTNTYGGYFISGGEPHDLVLPWQADKLELYNYTTGANPIVWFRDFPAATALGGGIGTGSAYGYVYALTAAATVAAEAPVLWTDAGPLNGVAFTAGSGNVTIATAGTYKIEFSVSGTEASQFAIFVNGAVNLSTIYGSGAGTQQNTGMAILTLAAGDVLSVVNHTSASAITLAPNVGGTANNVRASLTVNSLGSVTGSSILTNGISIDNTLGGFANEHLIISGITTATPGVVTTTTPHNLSNFDRVVITKVIGTAAAQLNNNVYVVQVLSSTTFALYDTFGLPIPVLGAYTSSGQVTKIAPLLGQVGSQSNFPAPQNSIQDYPIQYRLLLGSAVIGADSDVIYFVAYKFNAYFNLGDIG